MGPGRNALRAIDRSAAFHGPHAGPGGLPGPPDGTGAPAQAGHDNLEGPGNDLPEVSRKGARAALPHLPTVGRGTRPSCQRGEPIEARPIGRIERFSRWCRRNPAIAGLLATVLVLLLVGTSVSTVLALVTREQTRIARGNEKRAKETTQEVIEKRDQLEEMNNRLVERDRLNRRLLYGSRMALAQSLVRMGEITQAQDLVNMYADAKGSDDPRSIEWYLIRQTLNSSAREFAVSPQDAISAFDLSPNGRQVAYYCKSEGLVIRDQETGNVLFSERLGPASWVKFSPKGDCCVVCGDGGSVAVVPLPIGSADVRKARLNVKVAHDFAFHPNGREIVVSARISGSDFKGDAEYAFLFYDIQDLCETRRVSTSIWFSNGRIVVSPDGLQIAGGINTGHVFVVNAETGEEIARVKGHGDWIFPIVYSEDGSESHPLAALAW